MCAATLGFFVLNHVGLSVTTRQFQSLMPAIAIMAGVGVVAVVRAIAALTTRAPFGVVAGALAAAVALAIPGAMVRRVALLAVSALIGLASHLLVKHQEQLRLPILGAGILTLAIVMGTPTLNSLARGLEFQGFPDDRHFREISGGVRVATFRRAEPRLRAAIEPGAVVLTSKPYQVAYHTRLGWPGFMRMRIWSETSESRRLYLSDERLQDGRYDWIVEYNQLVLEPDSDEGEKFEDDFRWLTSRPYLRAELVLHDAEGRLMLYALRHSQ
jgi:hypothetical protein